MAVHAADEVVHDGQGRGLERAALLPLRIVQVVGMDDPHHVVELVCPSAAMVVPGKVLWLLQHRDVRLGTSQAWPEQ